MSNLVFDRFAATLNSGSWLSMDYRMSNDLDTDNPDLTIWEITLLRNMETRTGDVESQSVAVAKLAVVDVAMCDHHSAYAAFDAYSGSTETVAAATVDHWAENSRFVIVDEVIVEPEYRGHGLGPMLVAEALTKLGIHRMPALVMLESGSFDHETMTPEEETAAAETISRAWARAGFKRVETVVEGNFSILKRNEISVKATETRVMEHLNRNALISA